MSRTLAIFGIKLKKDVLASLLKEEQKKAAKYGRSANGNSRISGSVNVSFDNPSDPDTLTLTMADYWYWIDKGRRPGGVAKKADIAGWIRRKALNPAVIIKEMELKSGIVRKKPLSFIKATEQFSFIVRRSLKRKGYDGNEFYSKVINDGRLDKLRKDLANEYRKDIKIIITNGSNSSN